MENIEKFLKAAHKYGVPNTSLFQTVELYEARNLPMVLATISHVGTEVSTLILLLIHLSILNWNVFNSATCNCLVRKFHIVLMQFQTKIISLQSYVRLFPQYQFRVKS